jgi:hypothetical protein
MSNVKYVGMDVHKAITVIGMPSVRISANVNTDFGHREHMPNEIGVGG